MATPAHDIATNGIAVRVGRRWRSRAVGLVVLFLAVLIVLLVSLWLARERVADQLIADQIDNINLSMTYDVEEISPERQILTNVVVGDPASPDLTIDRVTIRLDYDGVWPTLGLVTVEKPRLFGSLRNGSVSFGSLDPVLFDAEAPSQGLPEANLHLIDGRALLETDYGPVGVKVEGNGFLHNGFAARLGAIMPQPQISECQIEKSTAYGELRIEHGNIRFEGPVRMRGLDCGGGAIGLANVDYGLEVEIDAQLNRIAGQGTIESGRIAGEGFTLGDMQGELGFDWSQDGFDTSYDLEVGRLALAGHQFGRARILGTAHAQDGFDLIEAHADLGAEQINLARMMREPLANLRGNSRDSLIAPLLDRLTGALEREAGSARVNTRLTLRRTGDLLSLVMPELAVHNAQGASILTASHIRASQLPNGALRLVGNFQTTGRDLPQMHGRMEKSPDNALRFRLALAPYVADKSSLAVPELVVVQSASGAIGFAGHVAASGPLPGGHARDLVVPVSGNWSQSAGLSLWRSCVPVRFRELSVASLTLGGASLTLCPPGSEAILRYGPEGIRLAAGTPALRIAGKLAGTPIRLRSGPVGMAYPGIVKASNLDVVLGEYPHGHKFAVSNLLARTGQEIDGHFSDAAISISALPLDMKGTSGRWAYREGQLTVGDAQFQLSDREFPARFEPLAAREAVLKFADNRIVAHAALRHPASDRIISTVNIKHDLGKATGVADLDVAQLQFDAAMQPDELTELALGIVANVEGVVRGSGHIAWNPREVTSSGQFSTESLDLAAVFGPVEDVSGSIKFDDLLSLTTAPGQRIHIGSVNPGIEVFEGDVSFSLRDGHLLNVDGGSWPFMGGILRLQPVDLDLQADEERRYIFEIEGANAAEFIEEYELSNLSISGHFDGVMPIVFDRKGYGAIRGGVLTSRQPGGNLSYLGELAYEDMGQIANFAFRALRSLDYQSMSISMDGPLTGDIDTRMRIDGVRQAEGTSSNFITRRIAKLPIRFNINIKAPFYQMITSLRSLYDSSAVRDPRELGLIGLESESGESLSEDESLPEPVFDKGVGDDSQ